MSSYHCEYKRSEGTTGVRRTKSLGDSERLITSISLINHFVFEANLRSQILNLGISERNSRGSTDEEQPQKWVIFKLGENVFITSHLLKERCAHRR